MDIRKVKKLIELVEESSIDEIEIKEGDEYVRISRRSSAAITPAANTPPTQPRSHRVESPMVGTYYQRPAAAAEPFVRPGQQVEIGDTLCIIEAMKMMNPVLADRAGQVRDILVEDGQTVEFGQALLTLV